MTLDELRRLAEIAKSGGLKAREQHVKNEVKLETRRKKAKLADNLKGPGALRFVPPGSVKRLERIWMNLFSEHHPDVIIGRWFIRDGERLKGGKEVGLTSKLIQKYGEPLVAVYFRYVVENWVALHDRFPKSPLLPTIGWIFVMSETLVPEAQRPAEANGVPEAFKELEAWLSAHPGEQPPEELLARVPSDFLKPKGD